MATPLTAWHLMFTSGHPRHATACLAGTADDAFAAYTLGYLRAARALAKQVIDSAQYQDTLVYPIVYCVRHYLELSIKRMLWLGRIYQDDLPKFPTKGHRLTALWSDAQGLISEVYPDFVAACGESLAVVTEAAVALTSVDPNGEDFRYCVRTDLSSAVPGVTHINIARLASELERLDDTVGSILAALGQAADYAMDARSNMER